MTPKRLAEIRQRVAQAKFRLNVRSDVEDIRDLLAEIDRLRGALEYIASRKDYEMETAKTLHYDMRGVARKALYGD